MGFLTALLFTSTQLVIGYFEFLIARWGWRAMMGFRWNLLKALLGLGVFLVVGVGLILFQVPAIIDTLKLHLQ